MAVYVDDFRAARAVKDEETGRTYKARWSHLTADTVEELHEFAARLGQKRSWFQGVCKTGKCPAVEGACRHFHYDVVDAKRTKAIALGARAITLREFGDLIRERKDRFQPPAEEETDG